MTRVTVEKLATLRSWIDFSKGVSNYPIAPVQIFLEASNVCDLKCVMCTQFSSINRNRTAIVSIIDRQFVDLEALQSLGDALRHAFVVHLHGGGEPTLHPKFLDAIKVLGSYDVMVEFFTNGMHLTDELVDSLVDQRVHQVMASWSGATKFDYESVYHGGTFETLLDGLRRLKKAKTSRDSRYPRISVNSIGFRHHLEKLDSFVEIAADHGVNTIFVKPLNEWGFAAPELVGHAGFIVSGGPLAAVEQRAQQIARDRGVELHIEPYIYATAEAEVEHKRWVLSNLPREEYEKRKPVVPIEQFKVTASALKKEDMTSVDRSAGRTVNRAVVSAEATLATAAKELRIVPFDWPGTEAFYCMEPFKTLYIEANRRAKPCCNMPVYTPALGKAGSSSGLEIWNGPGFQAIREGVWRGEYSEVGCSNCLKAQSAPGDHWVDTLAVHYDQWYTAKYGVSLFGGEPYKLSGVPGVSIAARQKAVLGSKW